MRRMVGGCQVRSAEAIRLLAECGANLHVEDNRGQTPISYINRDLIPAIVDAGADINFQNREKQTALHLCIMRISQKDVETAKALIESGANPNVRNSRGETPFLIYMFACFRAYNFNNSIPPYGEELAKYMVEHGADIYARDNSGRGIFDTKSPLVDKLKKLYEHIKMTQQVHSDDIDEFIR